MRQISRRKWISGFMSGIVLTAALLGGGAAASAADNWFDRYKAWDNRHGGEFYSRVDSADLGWQENYVLRSYMNMYEVTKDTGWLDKLVTHADTIMDKASDPDGDGYSGWDSNRFSPGLLANGSFATAASGDAT
ncbi:MAG: hypothetical protein K0R67_3434, partial [Paenibacillus sp.]|nr:hypothetical protein [Paenibacillus sp.]